MSAVVVGAVVAVVSCVSAVVDSVTAELVVEVTVVAAAVVVAAVDAVLVALELIVRQALRIRSGIIQNSKQIIFLILTSRIVINEWPLSVHYTTAGARLADPVMI